MLNDSGMVVGKDRVQRIWRREGLRVPQKQPKRSRLWLNDGSCIRLRPEHPNHVWSFDFVEAATHDGRRIRLMTLIDEFTRKCLAIQVARRINAIGVIETLADAMLFEGIPVFIRSDNGPEMVAKVLRQWLSGLGTKSLYIESGSPWENGYCESFNGKLRDELPRSGRPVNPGRACSARQPDLVRLLAATRRLTASPTIHTHGLVVLVGRCANGTVDVIGELPVGNIEKALASYQDEALFPVAPMTHFLGRVMLLGKLVEEGRLTGRTVNGTTAGEKQKEQRTLTLVPCDEGPAKVVVPALYADASVVVTAVPHHEEIDLGHITSAKMMERKDFLALEDDVVDGIERRLVTVTAQSTGGKLSWSLKNSALLDQGGTVAPTELACTDLAGKFMTPLAVEGFRPRFTVEVTKAQVVEVLTSRYSSDEGQKKADASDEAFDVQFVGNGFSARTLGDVGNPGGAGAKEPVGICCRECDAHGLLTPLTSQKTGTFTFEGDPRGLLAVSWTDDVGSY